MRPRLAAWACVCLTITGAVALPELASADVKINSVLLAAIRDGDGPAVQALLGRGADVNARDESGATALMQAAVNSDAAMMAILLNHGADTAAKSPSGATALLWSLHDPQKMKLLLDRRAPIPDQAVFVAVARPDGVAVVKRLGDRGMRLDVSRNDFTPLMAAAHGGDPETVRFLIEHGADVRARTKSGYTALYGAASWPRNATVVGLLLDRGADPNVRVQINQPTRDILTPLMVAALLGDVDSVGKLLAAKADVNVQGGAFGRTALIGAATTDSEDTVKRLLLHGADVNARDALEHTARQWARRRGETAIVRLLDQAGAKESLAVPTTDVPRRLHGPLGTDSVQGAVAASLPLLQRSGQQFTDRRGCVSCHHQSLVAMTVGLARQHGFAVDETAAGAERAAVLEKFAQARERLLVGDGVTDDLVPAYALVGLAADGQAANATTDALVQFLALRQRPDGSWRTPVNRPPQDASDFTFTALAIRGLRLFAAKGRDRETEERIARARGWLVGAKPLDTEDRAFRLLGLRWADAGRTSIQDATDRLLRAQRDDGGWGQLFTMESDAYATGQVLYALHVGGMLPVEDPAYRRGVEYLLRTQLADGTWFVASRSFPFQPYGETGFPHGRSQFISASGTCWAVMVLTLAVATEKTRK